MSARSPTVAPVFVAGDSGPVIYSASDLAAAARCEYALLRSFDGRLGRGPAVVGDDELLIRTADALARQDEANWSEYVRSLATTWRIPS